MRANVKSFFMRNGRKLFFLLFLVTFAAGCGVYETLVNISRLQFKLGDVNNFKVSGITIEDKQKLSDINPIDAMRLAGEVANGRLPVSFTLNVLADNPNDGNGGYPAQDITLKAFPWTLHINDKETISGNVGEPIVVPGVGENKVIPLTMEIDLMAFFKDKGFEEVINLALNIGGRGGSSSDLKLVAQPVIGTPIGDMKYPEKITIVNTTFK